jgi:uncharacterized protein (TIGR03435 family)
MLLVLSRVVALGTVLLVGLAAAQPTRSFDVASVKANKSDAQPNSNFPLGPGDVYSPNGGYFSATNFPLVIYIVFAYKIAGNQMQTLVPQLPGWVATEKFDIQARVQGNPGKDEMRMMMRTLLAERFQLAVRMETRQAPVLAWVLLKPGTNGPKLRPHPAEASCSTTPDPSAQPPTQPAAREFPSLCNGIFGMPPSARGRMRFGARNVTIRFIADSLSGALGRPMVDQTGLSGTFDFTIEFTPERPGPATPGADIQPDNPGPTFEEALREQLGIKLQSQKAPVEVLVIDHVERPSAN